MATRDDLGRTVDEAEDALHAAMRTGDTGALLSLLAEGLSFELPGGLVIGRAADLEAHESGATRFEKLSEVRRSTIESGGHGRVLTVADIVVVDRGRRVEARMTYRRFWTIIDGRWQVVAGNVEPSA